MVVWSLVEIIPLALLHNYNTNATGSYDRSLLFFIFTEVWEQVQKTTITHSPYVKALLEFCITPVYHKEKAKKQCLKGFKFSVTSSTAKQYKSTLQAILAVVESHDRKLRQEESEAKQLLVVTQTQPKPKESIATADNILDTLGIDDTSSRGLEDVPESEDDNKVIEPRKRKLQHPEDQTFKIPRKNNNRFEVSKASESESQSGTDVDTTIQHSSYQARTKRCHDTTSSLLSAMEGTTSADMAHAGAGIIKHTIPEGIKAQKSILNKISDINIEALLDLAICRKGKAPQNLSPAFSDALQNSTKYDEFPAFIRAQMQKMQNASGYKSFTLCLLDKKFLEKLIKPADLIDGDMINTIFQVTGFSPFSFITNGMTVQTVNGQEVHIPKSTTEVFDMLGCTILYLKVVCANKHMLLHNYEECLLPGLQDSTQLLNQQFKQHGQAFGFQLFKQVHNITM